MAVRLRQVSEQLGAVGASQADVRPVCEYGREHPEQVSTRFWHSQTDILNKRVVTSSNRIHPEQVSTRC